MQKCEMQADLSCRVRSGGPRIRPIRLCVRQFQYLSMEMKSRCLFDCVSYRILNGCSPETGAMESSGESGFSSSFLEIDERTENVMLLNLHTHTPRCNHARGDEREYIERAIQAGFHTLGFSDHSPMPFDGDYYSGYRMRPWETEGYVSRLLELREEYKNDIRVLIGFEAEYYPAYFDRLIEFLSAFPIDYLILGQHFLFDEENAPYSGEQTEDEGILKQYVDQTCEAMRTGRYTYFAHPDLIRYVGDENIYRRHILRLCQTAKELDVPLEINLLGVWDNRHYPSERFFRLAQETGNKIILGLDAHQPERILEEDVLSRALALAERCGITPTEDVVIRDPFKK